MDTKRDWTHIRKKITDIRKFSEFYIFTIDAEDINSSLIVKSHIFEDRLQPYFLKEISKITRQEILDICWNMYITKGFYIKLSVDPNGQEKCTKYDMDPNKFYVSYLEIHGPLGSFQSIYNQITHNNESKSK